MLGRFWEVLGGQNGSQNRFFGIIFAILFSNAFLDRFFHDFSCFFLVRTLIFVRTASVLEDFHKIDSLLKSSRKTWILAPFSEAKMEKNERKIVLRSMRFFDANFSEFFCDF